LRYQRYINHLLTTYLLTYLLTYLFTYLLAHLLSFSCENGSNCYNKRCGKKCRFSFSVSYFVSQIWAHSHVSASCYHRYLRPCMSDRVLSGTRQLPRMLQALTSVARLSFSMTFLSRPSSPLSVHLPTRHPSDGILPCYRKSSAAAGGLGAAESTSTETNWSSPATRACRTDERRRRRDLQLSPPRQRSRSDASAYCRRRRDGRLDHHRLDHDHLDHDHLTMTTRPRPTRP